VIVPYRRTALRYLELGANQFNGSMPDIGYTVNLEEYRTYNNMFTGTIPPSLGLMTNLVRAYIGINRLDGTIPPFGSTAYPMPKLRSLHIDNNLLRGTLPASLGNLTELRTLPIYGCRFTGTIPPSLGNLKSLIKFEAYDNRLSGTLSPELAGMQNLERFDVFQNKLTGTVPPEFGSMSSLLQLMLYNNQLTGTIPPELGDMGSLRYLNLWGNALTGTLPPQLGQLRQLVWFDVSQNQLEGEIPAALSSIGSTLIYMKLSSNSLTGSIPVELGQLSSLKTLSLSTNRLSGTLASSLRTELTKLETLDLAYNDFNGTLPATWCAPYTATDATAGSTPTNSSIVLELPRWSLAVHGNTQLCGAVPWCLTSAISYMAGTEHPLRATHLVEPALLMCDNPDAYAACWSVTLANPRIQGLCDSTAPMCLNGTCNIFAPPIVTSLTHFEFSFIQFNDPESGLSGYEWGLGNSLGGIDDALTYRPVSNVSLVLLSNVSITQNPDMFFVQAFNSESSGLALVNGNRYYAMVKAVNKGGPRLTASVTSDAILVDSTPPIMVDVYPSLLCKRGLSQTMTADSNGIFSLESCWHFTEEDSWITEYSVAFFNTNNRTRPICSWRSFGANQTSTVLTEADLFAHGSKSTLEGERGQFISGTSYEAQVVATNAAGLSTVGYSYPMLMPEAPHMPHESSSKSLRRTILFFEITMPIAFLLIVAFFAFYYFRGVKASKTTELCAAVMQHLLDGEQKVVDVLSLLAVKARSTSEPDIADHSSSSVVFVCTDIVNSTIMAKANAAAYQEAQDIHDEILTTLSRTRGGYVCGTQGDAFEIVFSDVTSAICFAIDTQNALLNTPWSSEVLSLPFCEEVSDEWMNNVVAGNSERAKTSAHIRSTHKKMVHTFAGPQIRIGIHVGDPRSFYRMVDADQGLVLYNGPALRAARDLSDVACGGQILMSEATLASTSSSVLAACSFPAISELGSFAFDKECDDLSLAETKVGPYTTLAQVYQIHPMVCGVQPWRRFAPELLRRVKLIAPGRGLNFPMYPSITESDATAVAPPMIMNPGLWEQQSNLTDAAPGTAVVVVRVHNVASSTTRWHDVLRESGFMDTLDESLQSLCQLFDGRFAAENLSKHSLDLVLMRKLTRRDSLRGINQAAAPSEQADQHAVVILPAHTRAILFDDTTKAMRFAVAAQVVALHVKWDVEVLEASTGPIGKDALGVGSLSLSRRPEFAVLVHHLQFAGEGAAILKAIGVVVAGHLPGIHVALRKEDSTDHDQANDDDEVDQLLLLAPKTSERESINSNEERSLPPFWHETLVRLAQPGQLIVTAESWLNIQIGHLSGTRLIDLGIHMVEHRVPAGFAPWLGQDSSNLSLDGVPDTTMRGLNGMALQRTSLLQVVVRTAQKQRFPRVASEQNISPGFWDSPVPELGVGVVFCNPDTKTLADAGCPADVILAACMQWEKACRALCSLHEGYECKSPDPGRFTLAFNSLENTIRFACAAQSELTSNIPWSDELLECSGGKFGLRVAIGAAYGDNAFRKPLSENGRADYFGVLANLAARIASEAVGGQSLVEGYPLLKPYGRNSLMGTTFNTHRADIVVNWIKREMEVVGDLDVHTLAQKPMLIGSLNLGPLTSTVSVLERGLARLRGFDNLVPLIEILHNDAAADASGDDQLSMFDLPASWIAPLTGNEMDRLQFSIGERHQGKQRKNSVTGTQLSFSNIVPKLQTSASKFAAASVSMRSVILGKFSTSSKSLGPKLSASLIRTSATKTKSPGQLVPKSEDSFTSKFMSFEQMTPMSEMNKQPASLGDSLATTIVTEQMPPECVKIIDGPAVLRWIDDGAGIDVLSLMGVEHDATVAYESFLPTYPIIRHVTMAALDRLGLTENLGLDTDNVHAFLSALENEYVTGNPGSYHCAAHAADVTHAVAFILSKGRVIERGLLKGTQCAALLFAAAGHDVRHPGVTNSARLKRMHTKFGRQDSDAEHSKYRTGGASLRVASVNEEMHARITLELMSSSSAVSPWTGANLKMTGEDIVEANAIVLESILFTDIGRHGELLRRFNQAVAAQKFEEQSRNVAEGGSQTATTDRNEEGAVLPMEDSGILASLILHVADISNTARPQHVSEGWAELLRGEQSDMMGINKSDAELAASQASFGAGPVKSSFECLRAVLKKPLDEMLKQLTANTDSWQKKVPKICVPV